ncbi:MAG: hypothetical protein GAK28_01085 [Luteibacter sp.]|uniref:hypothetical protein n=1 Tax=Luteibacter sp. TaxID=1886636 RepID=UPI00137F3F0A|nr:hypothetical protein [Luteibacter sp.]KAF1008661.1 MAG: hypothetical protein GAK28_01085 [Luteibacter sp.]
MISLRHTPLRRLGYLLGVSVLIAGIAACNDTQPLATDQYVRLEFDKPARLETFDGSAGRDLPGLPNLGRFDVSRESARLCGADYDENYLLYDLRSGSITAKAKQPSGVPQPAIDSHGRCLVVLGPGHLGVLGDGAAVTEIALPDAGDKLPYVNYAAQADRFIARTDERIYVIHLGEQKPEVVAMTPTGQIGNLKASDWQCCAQLSPDGKTLYTVMDVVDDFLTGTTSLAAVDVPSGNLRKIYLSHIDEQGTHYDLPSSVDNAFALSEDGKTIFIAAVIDSDHLAWLRVDTVSGKVSKVRDGSGDPLLSDTGGFALMNKGDHVDIVKLPGGETVRSMPSSVARPLHR